jgi:NitT/TauT family transport system ATP-binding protein
LNDIQHAGVTSRFEIRIEEKTHVSADGTELVAIRDFVLDVEPESMTVLMGPSGCGKTTLLRIVAGLDERFVGDVGIPPDTRIGLMFQEPRLLPWRTVRQNIELVAAPSFTEADLEHLAQAVGIADMLPRYPQELSLGLARRVALARAFATKPDLLLLDEPFVSLDATLAARLREELAELVRSRPVTTLLVTHDVDEAIGLADRLFLLSASPARVLAEVPVERPRSANTPEQLATLRADIARRLNEAQL